MLSDSRRGLRVAFTCDANEGEWPVLVGRDFAVDPHARVVDILASEAPGADADELAPLFSCIPLRHLLHLVFNTLLIMSRSRRDRAEPRPPMVVGLATASVHTPELDFTLAEAAGAS